MWPSQSYNFLCKPLHSVHVRVQPCTVFLPHLPKQEAVSPPLLLCAQYRDWHNWWLAMFCQAPVVRRGVMDVLCLCNVEARAPGQGPHSSNRSGPQVAGNWDQSGSDTHRGRTDSDASHAQHLLILDCWGLSQTLLRIINSGNVRCTP